MIFNTSTYEKHSEKGPTLTCSAVISETFSFKQRAIFNFSTTNAGKSSEVSNSP